MLSWPESGEKVANTEESHGSIAEVPSHGELMEHKTVYKRRASLTPFQVLSSVEVGMEPLMGMSGVELMVFQALRLLRKVENPTVPSQMCLQVSFKSSPPEKV